MFCLFFEVFIKLRIPAVEVLFVCFILRNSKCFAEALIVNYLAFTEEADCIANVGVIDQSEYIIVCYPCFLLCCYVIGAFPVLCSISRYQ